MIPVARCTIASNAMQRTSCGSGCAHFPPSVSGPPKSWMYDQCGQFAP